MTTKTKSAAAKSSPSAAKVVYKTSRRYGRLTAKQVKEAVAAVSRKSS
ncbi:MAG TPA: hypothetical protein VGB19_00865 [Actinomycetota bacterium]|nr:hypothetical protein [Actinomycetota bacterium]